MIAVQVVHTSALGSTALQEIRQLLDAAFDDGFTDDDFEHALGGMHALASDGDELVGHAAVVMRRLLNGDRALRTGYVEAVAVRADHRRQGVGGLVMDGVEQVVRGAYELGALSAAAGAARWYVSRGWQRWTGTTSVLAPDGRRRTPDEDDGLHVLPVAVRLPADGDLACDWRGGDVW